MKKIISLVLAAALSLSMFASDIFTYAPMQGDVASYKRTDYSIASRFGNYYRTPSVKFIHILDENGKEVESTEYSAKDTVVNLITSSYDVEGNLISQTATDADGQIIWTSEITYKNGLKQDISEFNAKKELKSKTIFTYTKGLLTDESSYDGEGALVWKIVYSYNDNGKVASVCNYFPTGALSEEDIYEYDENGVIKSITHTDSINKTPVTEVFRYNGNILTEITTYDEAKKITKRDFFKYDKDQNIAQVSTYNIAEKFGTTVSELAAMSDFSFTYTLSDDDEVIMVSEK